MHYDDTSERPEKEQRAYERLLQTVIDLFRRPSPSGFEFYVRDYVIDQLRSLGFAIITDKAGNVLATRGTPTKGEGYPMLSFHMDIVSYEPLDRRLPDHWSGETWPPELGNESKKARRRRKELTDIWRHIKLLPPSAILFENGCLHTGGKRVLGGDDKCGGAIALTLAASTTLPLKIVASVQEEIGCVGIDEVDPAFFADVSYALVLDRRGSHDLITSIARRPLCQSGFAEALVEAAAAIGHTVHPTEGALSDALTLSHYIVNVVNMSVGYYNPHTAREFVVCAELIQAYRWACQALATLPRAIPKEVAREDDPWLEDILCPTCGNLLIELDQLTEDLLPYACLCGIPDEDLPPWVKKLWAAIEAKDGADERQSG
jgi:hypothetical protein